MVEERLTRVGVESADAPCYNPFRFENMEISQWPAHLDSTFAAQRLATKSFKAAVALTIVAAPGLVAAMSRLPALAVVVEVEAAVVEADGSGLVVEAVGAEAATLAAMVEAVHRFLAADLAVRSET